MSSRKETKINRLLREWPRGTVATQQWLGTMGIGRRLADVYRKTGRVSRIGSGAYVRSDDEVKWTGAVFAIQSQLDRSVHPGAKTALEMHGYGHNLLMGSPQKVYLFGTPGTMLPSWFKKYDWGVKIVYHATNLFPSGKDLGFSAGRYHTFSLRHSSPERAIMEMLHLVPKYASLDEAAYILEGMTGCRPELVQQLLEVCSSVKVKRLFMYLAEFLNHEWLKWVDVSSVDFGSGKRVIAGGGTFNRKYDISVPKLELESVER